MEGKIRLLDESVIKRIAAGEVIHSPYNIVKELLENAADSGAEHVTILFNGGGLSLITIIDDGDGISNNDMQVVCKRHTTSKITTYNDLKEVKTFGFRGEALFSISCISDLTITSNTDPSSIVGVCGRYRNGELIDSLTEVSAKKGTTISVENIFTDNKQKRDALPSASTLKRKVLFLVFKYAIALPHISFVLFRDKNLKVNTPGKITSERVINETFKYMKSFRVDIQISKDKSAVCFLGNPTTKMMKMHGIFVNERLVSCESIKRMMCRIYSQYNVTMNTPFFIILLSIPTSQIDVNVHPTKKTVVLLREQSIVDAISNVIEKEMRIRFKRITSPKKEIVTQFHEIPNKLRERHNEYMLSKAQIESLPVVETEIKPIVEENPKELSKREKIDKRKQLFKDIRFRPKKSDLFNDVGTIEQFMKLVDLKKECKKKQDNYKSIPFMLNIEKEIIENDSAQLSRMFAHQKLIGICAMKYFVVDIREAMYLINIEEVTKILFYQSTIFHIGGLGRLILDEPINVHDCINITGEEFSVEAMQSHLDFLENMFAIGIKDGFLFSLPIIVPGYTPCFARLPNFLYLISKVCSFNTEEKIIKGVAKSIADFYCVKESDAKVRNENELKKVLEAQIFTELRRSDFHPPSSLYFDGHIKQITNIRHIERLFAPEY